MTKPWWLTWRWFGFGNPIMPWPWRPLPEGYRGSLLFDKMFRLTWWQRILVVVSGRIIIRTALMTDSEITRFKGEDQLTIAPPGGGIEPGGYPTRRNEEISMEKIKNREALKGGNPNPTSPWKSESIA